MATSQTEKNSSLPLYVGGIQVPDVYYTPPHVPRRRRHRRRSQRPKASPQEPGCSRESLSDPELKSEAALYKDLLRDCQEVVKLQAEEIRRLRVRVFQQDECIASQKRQLATVRSNYETLKNSKVAHPVSGQRTELNKAKRASHEARKANYLEKKALEPRLEKKKEKTVFSNDEFENLSDLQLKMRGGERQVTEVGPHPQRDVLLQAADKARQKAAKILSSSNANPPVPILRTVSECSSPGSVKTSASKAKEDSARIAAIAAKCLAGLKTKKSSSSSASEGERPRSRFYTSTPGSGSEQEKANRMDPSKFDYRDF